MRRYIIYNRIIYNIIYKNSVFPISKSDANNILENNFAQNLNREFYVEPKKIAKISFQIL